MGKILIGSVYVDHPRTPKWYEIQMRLLDYTLEANSFDHVVVANRCNADIFSRSIVVAQHNDVGQDASVEHMKGLWDLWSYFHNHSEYDHYLILDSDAFPYRKNWLERMLVWMREDDRLPERQWASAVRCENLDTFPHPCVLFVKGQFLRAFNDPDGRRAFRMDVLENLMGYRFVDLFVDLPRSIGGQPIWMPMTRSNVWNPHPVLSALYAGMFYHHGAGSRMAEIRSVALRNFDHYYPTWKHACMEESVWLEISMNPIAYINQLASLP